MTYKVVLGTFAALAASGALVAGVAGKRIKVLGLVVSTVAATNVKLQSSGGADISLTMYLAANGGFVLPYSEEGWGIFTAVGEGLNLNMSAAASVGVQVLYELQDA